MPKWTDTEVLAELQPMFQEVLNAENLTISRTSSAMDTRNWDSLAHIELIEMVEHSFNIRFELAELQKFKQVGDLVDLVVAKANKP